MKPTHLLLAGCAILPLLATQAQAAPKPHHAKGPTTTELAAELEQLKANNQALQAKVDALVAALQTTTAKADTVQARTEAVAATAAKAEAEASAAQGEVKALPTKVAAAVEAAKPKTDRIAYKGLSIVLGGYLDMTSIYRSRNELADDTSTFSKIPWANNPLNHQNEGRLSGRGSRVSLRADADVSKTIHVTGYGEIDFLAAAQTANNNETSSYNPRIRQGWLNVDWSDLGLNLTAGEGWSLATLNKTGIKPLTEAIPDVLEYSYMPGFVYARQAELRVAKRFDSGLTLAAALENPATLVGGTAPTKDASGNPLTIAISTAGGTAFNSANLYTYHSTPDVILKAAYDAKLDAARNLHVEAFYLDRQFKDQVTTNATLATAALSSKSSSGGSFGVGVYTNLVPKVLDLQADLITGEGVGRYGASTLSDATYANDGSLKPLKETAWMVGLTWHATPTWDIYAYDGAERLNANAGTDGAGKAFGYGNALFNNAQCGSIAPIAGAACTANVKDVTQSSIGFWHKLYVGNFGRVQYGATYTYTKQSAFAGIGGAPSVDENIIMTSVRYYPF